MPYKWIEPELFLDYQDVMVWHTYSGNNVMAYWYTVCEWDDDSDSNQGFQFDVRDLRSQLRKHGIPFTGDKDWTDHDLIIKIGIDRYLTGKIDTCLAKALEAYKEESGE